MEIEEHRIQEFEELIQICINDASNTHSLGDARNHEMSFLDEIYERAESVREQRIFDESSNHRLKLDSKARNLNCYELKEMAQFFMERKKHHHAHYFVCEMYQRLDKPNAVELFIINGESFAPSIYWSGLYYYKRQDYGKAKELFERGYKKHHWFCGKKLSDLCLYGDFLQNWKESN